MFTKLDNQKGNPPKEFKIDSEKGNPPKEFKFAKVYSGVEIFSPSLTSKYWIVAKSKIPSFLLFRPFVKGARKEDSKKAMLSILKDIAKDGLYVTMKKENAHKLKSLYETKYEPSMVEEFKGDIKDPKKFRPRPGAGVEQEGKDDLEAVDRSKVKEPSVDADGAKDMPLKHSSTRKQAQDLEELFKIIDAEEAKGTSDDQIIKMIDVWIEGKGKGSSKVVLDKKVEKNLVAGKRLRTNPYSASVTDRAVRDMKGIEKLQPEAATGSVAKGEDDIAKIKRDEVRADEVYSGGKDDLDIKRDQVVDLKASVEKKRKYLFAKELELKKAKIELHQQKEAEFEEYKKSFRDRFIRALRLAVKRANLNIIDNELKLVFGDVLTTPTEDYVGMDSDLAMYLIEGAFSKGEDTYIKSLLKEAGKYVDLPEESFLILEEDAQKVNPIIPLVASLKEVEEQENALVEKAEGNNPVFMPKDGSAFSGKWEHLKGVFNERLI